KSAAHSADYEAQLAADIGGFTLDPLGHVLYVYPWGVPGTELAGKEGPRTWQREVLQEIGDKLKSQHITSVWEAIQIATASGHGIGKSALVSWIVKWAMDTCPHTKGVVTANTENQLRTKTWPEVAKWHRLSLTSHWFKLNATSLEHADPENSKTWRIDAVPWSEHNSEAFAGLHNEGRRVLLVFDEA